jgi:antitoxin component HigA of HigAB toxin-antitoxin module
MAARKAAKTAVVGVYTTPEGVELAGNTLVTSGFSNADISVLLPDDIGSRSQAPEILLSVQCVTSDQIRRAEGILERTMAQDGSFRRKVPSAILDQVMHRAAAAK